MVRKIARLLRRWLGYLDGVLFHERCRVCSNLLPPTILIAEHYLVAQADVPKAVCIECWRHTLASNPTIELCPLKDGSLSIASGRLYTGAVKRLIYKLKYDNDRLLACDLSLLMDRAWSLLRHNYADEPVLLVPIPLHPERLWQRGYNQAEEIAKHLSTRIEVPVEPRALKRVKNTQAQYGLSRAARLQNMRNAFVGMTKYLSGRHVVLIDDVYTSGSTLVEAAEALLRAGAASVAALTVARAVLKDRVRSSKHRSVDMVYQSDNVKERCST